MRLTVLAVLIGLGNVAAAAAQPASRFEVGPVMRAERVLIDGDTSGNSMVAGLATTFKFNKT